MRIVGVCSSGASCRRRWSSETGALLGAVLALLAVATLIHVLLTSVRRRRPDLAVLKSLGLLPSQVLSTVLWQATALAAASLLVGLPLGILAGRWAWVLFAGLGRGRARGRHPGHAGAGRHPGHAAAGDRHRGRSGMGGGTGQRRPASCAPSDGRRVMGTPRLRPAGPVWLALRADLRLRWRAVLGLALLLGLIGGVVLTAAAGARRTDTAYPRLLRWSHAASVQVVPTCAGLGGFYHGLAHLPQVASIWTGVVYTLALPPPAPPGSQLEAVASPDGALGTSTDRVRVLAGRPFDPADPRAVMIDQELAAAAHVRPGGTLRLLGDPSTPKTCAAGGGTAAPGRARPVPLAFRVSAVVAFDDQVVPSPGLSGAPRVLLSPGFWRSGAGREFGPGDYAGVRLRPGVGLASFRRAVAALARRYPSAGRISVVNMAPQVTATEQAIRPQVVSLAVFAALTGLIGLAILAQLLGRQLVLDSAGFPTLRALGMTRRSLAALSLARVTAVTVPAACLAVAVAVAASPLMPIGPARAGRAGPGRRGQPRAAGRRAGRDRTPAGGPAGPGGVAGGGPGRPPA